MSTKVADKELVARATTRLVTVSGVRDVGPHLRQVTVGGPDLEGFEPVGPDTFLYVLLPPVGGAELTIDQTFTWAAYQDMPLDVRPTGAYYTVRRWRPADLELDLLFVLHGDEGRASGWAARVEPGAPLALWGPRTMWHPPAATDRFLLVADDTGLPAIAGILDELPDDARVTVVAEVGSVEEQVDLRMHHGVVVRWLHRHGAAPGTTTALADEVRSLSLPTDGLYAWGGGESHAMTAVRKHLRHERGCDREQVSMVAYWRHTDHDVPDDEE